MSEKREQIISDGVNAMKENLQMGTRRNETTGTSETISLS